MIQLNPGDFEGFCPGVTELKMKLKDRPIFRKFISDFSFSFLLKIGSMGLGLLVTRMLARRLGVEGYGIYSVACALIMLFQIFVQFSVRGILVRDVRSGKIPLQRAAESLLCLACIMAPLMYLILIGAGFIYDPSIIPLLLLGGLSYFLTGNRSLNAILHASGRIKTESFVNLLVVLFNFLLLLLFLGEGGSISTVFLCSLGSVGLALVYQNYAVSREVRIRVRRQFKEVGYLMRESWPLVFAGLIQLIHSRADLFMLEKLGLFRTLALHLPFFPSHLLPTSFDTGMEVGIYAGAYRFFEMPIFIPTYILATGYPILSGLTRKIEFRHFRNRLGAVLAAASLLVMIVLYLFARPLVHLVLGTEFSGSIPVLKIFVFGIPAMMLRPLFRQVVIIRRWQHHLTWILLSGVILNVLMNLYLIPLHGSEGAALATVISESLTAGLIIFVAGRAVGKWGKE